MSITTAFSRLNKYFDKNKVYYTLLEISLVMWVLYALGVMSFVDAPWLTQHISNMIGSIVLMLVVIGPAALRSEALPVRRIYLAIAITLAVNLILEIINPVTRIDTSFLYWEDFNKADLMDAAFGSIGIIVVILAILVAKKMGQAKQ